MLVPRFTKEDITKLLQQRVALIEQAVLMRLQRIGETFVTNARNNGSYTDRTGNLRSSTGYVVLKNGVQYNTGGFSQVKGGAGGTTTGRRFIDEVKAKFPTGLVLIVVAGMDYAAAVEAKGKDVLTGSSQVAKKQLKEAIRSLSKKVGKI